jgi:hypothetical protein
MVDTLTAAMMSRNVNDQQKQMAIIAHDYLHEPLAVNDIGLVSFYFCLRHRSSDRQCLVRHAPRDAEA